MTQSPDSRDEAEQWRQEALAELDGDAPERFGPGTLGCHEALHTAHVAQEFVERHVLNHPAVILNPEWFRRAFCAVEELGSLYQAIGKTYPPD